MQNIIACLAHFVKRGEGWARLLRLFTGQPWHDTIGLYGFPARMYDPFLGQFIQPDSLVPDPLNPIALNRYAYAYNSPLVYTDPSGHDPLLMGAAVFLIGGLVNVGVKALTEPGYDVLSFEGVLDFTIGGAFALAAWGMNIAISPIGYARIIGVAEPVGLTALQKLGFVGGRILAGGFVNMTENWVTAVLKQKPFSPEEAFRSFAAGMGSQLLSEGMDYLARKALNKLPALSPHEARSRADSEIQRALDIEWRTGRAPSWVGATTVPTPDFPYIRAAYPRMDKILAKTLQYHTRTWLKRQAMKAGVFMITSTLFDADIVELGLP